MKKEKIKQADLSTIFWTVLLVSVLFFLMLWMIAPQVANFYKLKVENGLTLTRLMALAIFLINIRMISLAILERQIRYLRLSIIEGGELLIIQTLAVLMAIKGFQIESLVVSYLVGKSLGTLAFYILSPFKLALGFAKDSLAKFLGFALNYQVYSLAYAVSGSIAPLYVGYIVGPAGTGYLTWAGGIGLLPWAFSELIAKVSFPVFSRIQNDKRRLSSSVNYSLNLILMGVLPLTVILLFFAEPITNVVFTYKWLPAVWALRFFVLLSATVAVSSVAASLLIACGEVRFVRNVSIAAAFCFWILAFTLIPKIGFTGHPLAWFLGSAIQFLMIIKVRQIVKIDYFRTILIYLFFAVVSTLPFWYVVKIFGNAFELVAVLIAIVVVYLILVFLFRKNYVLFYLGQLKVFLK